MTGQTGLFPYEPGTVEAALNEAIDDLDRARELLEVDRSMVKASTKRVEDLKKKVRRLSAEASV